MFAFVRLVWAVPTIVSRRHRRRRRILKHPFSYVRLMYEHRRRQME